jgi:hypothetical protein
MRKGSQGNNEVREMTMQAVYVVSTKDLPKLFEALRHAQVGLRFIEELGFTNTNDRLFIPLLKAMKVLDEAGRPMFAP